jgi:hypothetical protein
MSAQTTTANRKWILAGLAIALAVGFLAGWFIKDVYQFGKAMGCIPRIIDSAVAPDKKHTALIFEMECGATVGRNTQISIATSQSEFSPDRFPPVFVAGETAKIALRWTSERNLIVTNAPVANVYRRQANFAEISIQYQ